MSVKKLIFVFLAFFGLASQPSVAQDENVKLPNNKVSLNGKEYYMHIVRKGETLSAISRAYEIPIDTIIADNPQLTFQIHPDQYIKIRIKPEVKVEETYNYHLITKGDTPYNIAKRYGISIDELYKMNPGSELGIKIGDRLRIKIESKESTAEAQPADTAFIFHKVEKQETLFGIAHKYQTTPAEIEKLNPEIAGRSIQVDEMLKVPVQKEIAEDVIEGDFDFHKVEKQETLYGIAHAYGITDKTLLKLNPDLKKRSMQEGELIRIPKGATKAVAEPAEQPQVEAQPEKEAISEPERQRIEAYEADNRKMHTAQDAQFDKTKTYKVAFFLPFYLNMNDTTGWGDKTGKVYNRSKNFIEFYTGSMLALNELKRQGLSFDIQVIDTKGDSLYITNYLRNHDLSDVNLFIGPAFSGELQVVGDYAWEHQINIVSPLSVKPAFIDHNPYAFQVGPTNNIQMKYVADFLNQIDTKNYIVIHNGNAKNQEYEAEYSYISEFKRQFYASITSDNLDQVRYNEYYYYSTNGDMLNSAFMKGKENIVIIPSTDRAFVTDIMGKLNGYSYEYNVKVLGRQTWERFESIDIDNFHNTNTHYLSNSYIDYSKPEIIDFVRNYRNILNTEPDRMAFQGYDITMFFCSALNKYGHDFRHYIMFHNAPLLQTEFNFVPFSDQGGYQNTAIYILNYDKDYSIKKAATYPEK